MEKLLVELLDVSFSEEVHSVMTKLVSLEEEKNSIFSIGGEKALGPDGYTSQFFKVAWPIV